MEPDAVPEEGQTEQPKVDEEQNLSPEELRERLRQEREQREHLERKLGEQGRELGFLRQKVDAILAAAPPKPQEDRVSDYRSIGERIILEPDEAIPALASKIREETREEVLREVRGELARQMAMKEMVDQFYQKNPDLADWRDVVAIIGQGLQRQHPDRPLPEILEETARQAREWLSSADERFRRRRGDSSRKLAATTTSGGMAREGAPAKIAEVPAKPRPSDPQEAAVMDAVEELRQYRLKRMTPPRVR